MKHAGYSCAQKDRWSDAEGAPMVTYVCPKPLPEVPSARVGGLCLKSNQRDGPQHTLSRVKPFHPCYRDIKSRETWNGNMRIPEGARKFSQEAHSFHTSVPTCHFSSAPAKEQAPSSNFLLNTFHQIPSHTFLALQASLPATHRVNSTDRPSHPHGLSRQSPAAHSRGATLPFNSVH